MLLGLRRDKVFRISEELVDSKECVWLGRPSGLYMKLKPLSPKSSAQTEEVTCVSRGVAGSAALVVWLLMYIPQSVRELGGRTEAAGGRVSRGAEAGEGSFNKIGACGYSILSKLPKGTVQIATQFAILTD